jgi:hypothetical protein
VYILLQRFRILVQLGDCSLTRIASLAFCQQFSSAGTLETPFISSKTWLSAKLLAATLAAATAAHQKP